MADTEIPQQLTDIHQTLELIALLLAVVVFQQGGLGVIVGSATILLLILNVIARGVWNADG